MDLQAVASSGGSDTAYAARAVQTVLRIDQTDFTMHIVSLLLAYSISMRNNYKTDKLVDKEEREIKTRCVVTPGGAFPFGADIVKALKDISNYFGSSPQQKEDYKAIKKGAVLPTQNIKSPSET